MLVPTFVCLCEEVTLEELMRVVREEGLKDLESLKRRLRIGMGSCGGRYCISLLLRVLPSITGERPHGRSDEELHVPVSRPPTKPVALRFFKG